MAFVGFVVLVAALGMLFWGLFGLINPKHFKLPSRLRALALALGAFPLAIVGMGIVASNAETPAERQAAEAQEREQATPAEITSLSTAGDQVEHLVSLEHRRICLDVGGSHVVEAGSDDLDAAATGILSLEDGSEEGAFVALAMATGGWPEIARSEPVDLHAGEPCYRLSADTGIRGAVARVRLIRLN